MIDVKELRIGNLVKYDNRVFTIHTIAKEFPTLDTSEFGIGVVDWNNLEPIELTEKWLKKLGFRLETFPLDTNSSKPCYFKPEGYVKISMTDTNDMFWFSHNYTNRKIKYVHQLQNLYYALTGEELTINN